MKTKQLTTKSEAELSKLLGETREEIRDLRFKLAANQLSQVRKIRVAKKLVARIETLLRQKKVQDNQ